MISFIINNQASKCPKDVFYQTLKSAVLSRTKNELIIVIDDSGEPYQDDYYTELHSFSDIHFFNNTVNEGLLKSRYLGLCYANDTYVRFIDSGDTCINHCKFKEMTKYLEDIPYSLIEFEQDNNYYHAVGITNNLTKLRTAALTGLMCSTTWTKLYHRESLVDTFNKLFNDGIPHLFHMEDYLILNAYLSNSLVNYTYVNTPFIHYELNGESNRLEVTQSKLDKVKLDATNVKKFIKDSYGITDSSLDSLIDCKVSPYVNRFKVV